MANPSSPLVLDRNTLHSAVVTRLRKMIVEGELIPGSRLNERMLCSLFGVSRTPLREAFKVLSSEGLVELLPNRGAIVVAISPEEIAQIFEVMAGLEAMSGELACERMTYVEMDEIRALHYEMLACHARHDQSGYYNRNMQIHFRINQAARNAVLTDLYHKTNSRIQGMRFRSILDDQNWEVSVQEHSELLDALAARDAAKVGAILRSHLLKKRDSLLAELQAPEAKTAST